MTVEQLESNMQKARTCLALIRDIAARGALSQDPENVGYALQELSQVFIERAGTEERYFEPISATLIEGLEKLHAELGWVDAGSQDLARGDLDRNCGQWN